MSSLGALASLVRTLHAERGVLARPELELAAAGIDPNAPKTCRKINPSGDPAAAKLVVGAHLMAALPSSAMLRFTMTACIAVSSVDSLIVGVRCSSVDSRTMQHAVQYSRSGVVGREIAALAPHACLLGRGPIWTVYLKTGSRRPPTKQLIRLRIDRDVVAA